MLSLYDAYMRLKATFSTRSSEWRPISASQEVELSCALGRTLAEPVASRYDNPAFDQSAMDGIAFAHSETESRFTVKGVVQAGDAPQAVSLQRGECVRIMTGAPIPRGADTVQMVEKVAFPEAATALLTEPARPGSHIRRRGENMHAGDVLYREGTVCTPAVLAGLASQGIRYARVKPSLKVGIGNTGNEVVPYHAALQPGQIHNSNSPAIAALLKHEDTMVTELGVVPDEREALEAFMNHNTDLDLLVLSGGVSMGTFDFVPRAAEAGGFREVFHKVAMKPGKPIWFGAHASGTLLFGLPGNPQSAIVGTLLFVKPMVRALRSGVFKEPLWAAAELAEPTRNGSSFPYFQGVTLSSEDGVLTAHPLKTSGSGDLVRFSVFDTLAEIPPQVELGAGQKVQVLLSI